MLPAQYTIHIIYYVTYATLNSHDTTCCRSTSSFCPCFGSLSNLVLSIAVQSISHCCIAYVITIAIFNGLPGHIVCKGALIANQHFHASLRDDAGSRSRIQLKCRPLWILKTLQPLQGIVICTYDETTPPTNRHESSEPPTQLPTSPALLHSTCI